MQVSDLYFRLKLITLGFLTPISIFVGFLFSSPYLLKVNEPFHKSDVAILETNPLPSKKFLKAIAALHHKQTFSRLFLIIRDEKSETSLLNANDQAALVISHFSALNIVTEALIITPSSVFGDTNEAAKKLLKVAISEDVKSILILAKAIESKRTLKVYQKNLATLPIQVSVFPFPSEFTASNWFLSEDGFKEVSTECLKYIYHFLRGII